MRLVLASGSPRRARLLEQIGFEFEVIAPDVDEARFPGEAPDSYVERVARAKAAAVAGVDRLVVAGDTAVVHEGRVMGKPAHPDEARSMLERLQGTVHEVFTGLAVASFEDEVVVRSLVDVTEVEFLPMTAEEISDYVDSGEPFGRAGAYTLQGIGSRYISRVSGSPWTVIGLPIHLVPRLIQAAGLKLSTFARRVRA